MSNELSHYGIPGMRWGVRKRRDSIRKLHANEQSRREQLAKPKNTTDRMPSKNTGYSYKKKPVYLLSDTELRERVSRKEQEKRYNELYVTRGEQITKYIMNGPGKQAMDAASKVATDVAIGYGKEYLKKYCEKQGGELADIAKYIK